MVGEPLTSVHYRGDGRSSPLATDQVDQHLFDSVNLYVYMYVYVCMDIIYPPHKKPPLIRNPPLEGKNICYYQFRRRHDYPPHKKRCLVKPPPNTKNWRFC